ncbi:ribbon-helix-helix domain-containing protein, partial [Alphaproteobacteria bacterium]|nr:ribbon-helix-helix domain-containing protein [Alphaproteobacteria bacterium]
MQTPQKRSIVIAGHATSLSLEPVFWDTLRRMAEQRHISMPGLIAE